MKENCEDINTNDDEFILFLDDFDDSDDEKNSCIRFSRMTKEERLRSQIETWLKYTSYLIFTHRYKV